MMAKKKKGFGGYDNGNGSKSRLPESSVKVPRVFMGVPMRYHDGTLEPMAQKALDGAVSYGEETQSFELMSKSWKGMSITQNSYKLVEAFLRDPEFAECTHYLYTGDDLTFPPDGIKKLLDADKPVIVGCATWKTPPYWPNCDAMTEKGFTSKVYITREMLSEGTIIEVNAAGSGFMMIKREVMEAVDRLWTEYHELFKKLMPEKFQNWEPVPFFPVLFNGESRNYTSTDYVFSRSVRTAGYNIYLHCGVIIGHIWKKQISVLDHLNWRDTFGCSEEEQIFPLHSVKRVEFTVGDPVEEKKAEPAIH